MKLFLPAAIVLVGGLVAAVQHDVAVSAGGTQEPDVDTSEAQDAQVERDLERAQREIEAALRQAERAHTRAVEQAQNKFMYR